MNFGKFDPSQGLEALAREFWSQWGDFARKSGAQAPTGMPGWQEAVNWWSQLAHGGREEANAVVDQFNKQGAHWFGLMQSVASQFAGQESSAADVARAWQRAVGAQGENPFPEMFRGLRGRGLAGLEQWVEDASPFLDAWRKEATSVLGMPTFGLMREHQERWQTLQKAQLATRQSQGAYQALLVKVGQRAFELFEGKLEAQAEPGRGVQSARALFDLWIDAAEEGYAEIALSPEFRRVYGQMVNDQMRLRKAVQDEVERVGALFGLPGRSEVDASHRKLHAVEKELRALKRQMAELLEGRAAPAPEKAARPASQAPAAEAAAKPEAKPPKPAPKPAVRKAKPVAAKAPPAPKSVKAEPARKEGGKSKKGKPSKPAKTLKPLLAPSLMPVRPGAEPEAGAKSGKSTKRRSAK